MTNIILKNYLPINELNKGVTTYQVRQNLLRPKKTFFAPFLNKFTVPGAYTLRVYITCGYNMLRFLSRLA